MPFGVQTGTGGAVILRVWGEERELAEHLFVLTQGSNGTSLLYVLV